ncbi:scarecrow-like protein 34 [Rhodamnia argentea]|uniref:Scarecrow-like protein 34 n=1 Tax=Rhodamnia argentea TaxID=178133 RepID=A0A8B8PST6_9MYRT|nr:scarecrow-like protein 34 [Rhodamnia argentea]XP_048136454.1 scarecrow-like protein 34 [Rhodamnia argentea]
MESNFTGFTYAVDDFETNSLTYPANADHSQNLSDGFNVDKLYVDFNSAEITSLLHQAEPAYHDPSVAVNLDGDLDFPSTDVSSKDGSLHHSTSPDDESPNQGGEPFSPSDYSNSPDPVLRYIHQMLMEENVEEQPWIIPDDLALQDTEKSLYDVLSEKCTFSPEQAVQFDISQFIGSPSSNSYGSSSDQGGDGTTDTRTNRTQSPGANSPDNPEGKNHASLHGPYPGDGVLPLNIDTNSQLYTNPIEGLQHRDEFGDSLSTNLLVSNMFSNSDSVLQFNKGLEEARKFLPSSIQLSINREDDKLAPNVREPEKNGTDYEKRLKSLSESGSKGRKNHKRDDESFEEGRSNKQSASYTEDSDLSEMLDRVLLGSCVKGQLSGCTPTNMSQTNGPPGPNGSRGRRKKGNKSTVDLRSLLILCAQAVSANDFRTAYELLKQIRQDSSASGDGSQRLAHYFANGLEARLAGSVSDKQSFFNSTELQKRTVADKLKAYQLHLSACPFKKLPILFANFMLRKVAATAKVLHIIDFGIGYGFQWPILIQELSKREGGSPELRITGIDFPQSGFRPAQRIEDTGRRLTKYCERFKVPFEFHALPSRNWECIRVEDLNIRSGELVAVNCLSRFKNLYDETVEVDCPRDAVLKLIKSIKPVIFVHGISNGSYNAPFFLTRFREALFHLSAVYDMFDATIASDNDQRLVLEKEFYGREIINVVACEGSERVERPETYKQWQVRLARAGFTQLPLDQEVTEMGRTKLSNYYHKDFVLAEESNWVLLGWRGRIISACTCWVPV